VRGLLSVHPFEPESGFACFIQDHPFFAAIWNFSDGVSTALFGGGRTPITILWTAALTGIALGIRYNRRRLLNRHGLQTYYGLRFIGGTDPWRQMVLLTMAAAVFLSSNPQAAYAGTPVYDPVFYYYHPDNLGSSQLMTDRDGDVVQHYGYSPFGRENYKNNALAFPVSSRYTGQTLDEDTGLYYYGERHYDPSLARFIQADSIVPDPGSSQAFNRYAYCCNNPLVYTDPTGNFLVNPGFSIGQSVSAGLDYASSSYTWDLHSGDSFGWSSGSGSSSVWMSSENSWLTGAPSAGGPLISGWSTENGWSFSEPWFYGRHSYGGGDGDSGGGFNYFSALLIPTGPGEFFETLDDYRADVGRHTVQSMLNGAQFLQDSVIGTWDMFLTDSPNDWLRFNSPQWARGLVDEQSTLSYQFERVVFTAGAGLVASRLGGVVTRGSGAMPGATRPTFGPGPYAGESIPARSRAQVFTPAERAAINRIGQRTGCHTCGVKIPGTKSSNFVPDHQPVSALTPPTTPQQLYPQCIDCSRVQGLGVARQLKGNP
jgi:RHS repeat-associated protein